MSWSQSGVIDEKRDDVADQLEAHTHSPVELDKAQQAQRSAVIKLAAGLDYRKLLPGSGEVGVQLNGHIADGGIPSFYIAAHRRTDGESAQQ